MNLAFVLLFITVLSDKAARYVKTHNGLPSCLTAHEEQLFCAVNLLGTACLAFVFAGVGFAAVLILAASSADAGVFKSCVVAFDSRNDPVSGY